ADRATHALERIRANLAGDELIAMLADMVAVSNSTAWHTATTQVIADLTAATGTPPATLNVPVNAHWLDRDRLTEGLSLIMAEAAEADADMRLLRMVTGEPIEAGQRGYQAGLLADGRARGWRRGLESAACQLCTWWWRNGQVWP